MPFAICLLSASERTFSVNNMEYGLLGEHLPHSFSPEIHKAIGEIIGEYKYELFEISPEEVENFLIKRDFKGINVTIPYKQAVIPYLDYLDEAAKAIGAVNTVVNKNGKLYGYNTDFGGLFALFQKIGVDPNGKKAIILGNGGTSKTAEAVLNAFGAQTVLKTDLTATEGVITNEEAVLEHSDAEILVNTTPMGMFPNINGMAVDPKDFPNLKGAVDVVYNPLSTDFVQRAQTLDIPSEGGLYMLVMQAVLAAEKFFDTEIPKEKADIIYKKLLAKKRNVVLIGMPASGKSTVGKALSKELGMPLFDSDVEIVKKKHRTIPAIFAEKGEEFFRKVESEVIAELSLKTGSIIATGGGVVLNPENIRLLSKNGRIYFLDKPLESLVPTLDRPTAQNREAIEKRYFERYDLYKKYADKIIDCSETLEIEITAIKEDFL